MDNCLKRESVLILCAFSLGCGFYGSCCLHRNFQNLVTTFDRSKIAGASRSFLRCFWVRILIPRIWRFFCSLNYHHYSTLCLYKQNLETVLNELLSLYRYKTRKTYSELPSVRRVVYKSLFWIFRSKTFQTFPQK